MKDKIFMFIKHNKGINLDQLSKQFKDVNISQLVNQLIDEELVEKDYKNRYYPVRKKTVQIIGKISVALKGFGFVTDEEGKEYFVPARYINGAMHGDKVGCEVIKQNKKHQKEDGLTNVGVVKVLERSKDFFVGEVIRVNEEEIKVLVDDTKFTFPITVDFKKGILVGHKVLCKVYEFAKKSGKAHIVHVIGHRNDPGVDIMSLVLDKGIKHNFNEDTLAQASKAEMKYDDYQKSIRTDLRDMNIITIDPATAKDLDDAVFVDKLNDGTFRLVVSIADVSHYVTKNSPMDKEAYIRGTSVYLVDRVIPMLPHKLSNDICSLNPNVDRFTLTCDMIINSKGNIIKQKTYPSIINSKRRFSYEEVNEFFAGNNKLERDDPKIIKGLKWAKELGNILRANKIRRGYLEFNVAEPKIIVNEQGKPIDIVKYLQGEAQKMIEDFMIAANETIAEIFNQAKVPGIYRVHDKPKLEKLESFCVVARTLGVSTQKDLENIKNTDLQDWLEEAEQKDIADVISFLLLRSMNKAKYDLNNIGHYGLGSKCYTHFTSPIRRYPDLIVHRLLYTYLVKKDKSAKTLKELKEWIPKAADQSSNQEIKAVDCERAVNAMKQAEYMEQFIGKEFNGMITGVTTKGIFVALDNTCEGRIDVSTMKDDYYEYVSEQVAMIGQNSKKIFRLGDKVRIKVISANKNERKVDFEMIDKIAK